jgi:5-methylcytosine-specific restriction protein B
MYVIGTMNLADRSLANLDYALRRRFAFESLQPNFGEPFTAWCQDQGLSASLATEIALRVTTVNQFISEDPTLGPDFMIGHSFFCPRPTDLENGSPEKWFRKVVAKQIIPLLEQYWFDNLARVQEMRALLVEGEA